ncbi:TonB-dependent receptor [Sporocytophaga myxococcoides]|uniref:TonB-dependent receptor n=1 Tax=Sporocytophaga myxococcoides TaxID=153721 RepID=A0A098LGZ2_9BACT|nr:TonB-dependent receptor [Sporocytophaga myxococcoides]GAL85388.1 TonB-dependent receptor [Sporocytophaga myxococcoides]
MIFLKRNINKGLGFAVFFFMINSGINAQKVTITDQISQTPLEGVFISDLQKQFYTTSNSKGQADISQFELSDSIRFQLVGYKPYITTLKKLDESGFKVFLSEESGLMDGIVVSGSKFEERRKDIPRQIQIINSGEMQFASQETTADVLQNTGNVFVQRSQMGGGSPVMRGFEANKVLMVVDGIRMNNAVYRGGHLQNVITLDNSVLERTELLFGPGSVIYGSDALGGVMSFYTKRPVLSGGKGKTFVSANAYSRYSSANSEKTGHLDLNIGFNKIASFTSFTYSDFDDLRQGANRRAAYNDFGKRNFYVERIGGKDSVLYNSNSNIQKQSGYKQYDFLQKILFSPSSRVKHTLNFQYSTSSDIPRYDRLAQFSGKPAYAEWFYGPQKRLLASYHLDLNEKTVFYDKARIVNAYQDIEESRYDRRFNREVRNSRIEKLSIYSLNIDLEKVLKKNELRYGLDVNYNKVGSSAYGQNVVTGIRTPLDTRYPSGGSFMRTIAGYLTHSIELNKKLILSEGIRYSNVELKANFGEKTFFPFPYSDIKQTNGALNGNIGLVFLPEKSWRFSVFGSTGFRSPNVDDLSKVFESVPGNVIVPNPHLKPEYTYNGELSIAKSFFDRIHLEGTAYYTWYTNAITTKFGKYNGQDSILYDGKLSRVQTSANAGKAYIYGGNITLHAEVTKNIGLANTFNYTYGRIKTDSLDYPLDHIPPVFGRSSVSVKVKRFRGEFFVLYNGWKRLKNYNLAGEDNIAQATADGMPSWYTLNLRTAVDVSRYIQLQVSVENLLDRNYRIFASGISAPGRNFLVTLRVKV